MQDDLLRVLYTHLNSTLIGTMLSASVLVIILWTQIDHVMAGGWLMVMGLLVAMRYVDARTFQRFGKLPQQYNRWRYVFLFFALISGVWWGIGIVFFMQHISRDYWLVPVFFAGGMMASSSAAYASFIPAFLAFSIPVMVPAIIWCFYQGTQPYLGMGVVLGIYLIIISLFTHRNRMMLINTVKAKRGQDEANAQMHLQTEMLEIVARGKSDMNDLLSTLILKVEASCSGMLCSILLLDARGQHLMHGAAPSLSEAYNMALDGVLIGPNVASCGTAAWKKERVIVSDIATDPLWADYKDIALSHGLRACWSQPIITVDGIVLGTFSIYYQQPKIPDTMDNLIMDEAARITGLAIEHSRARQMLAQRTFHYQQLVETIPDAIIVHCAGKLVYVNPAAVRMFGAAKAEDMLGLGVIDFVPLDCREMIAERMQQAVKYAQPLMNEKLIRMDGAVFEAEVMAVPTIHEHEAAVEVIVRDISEQQTAKQQVEQQRYLLRTVLDTAPVGIWMLQKNGHIQFMNQAFCQAVGVSEAQFKAADHYSELLPTDEVQSCMDSDAACYAAQGLYLARERLSCVDGKMHDFDIFKQPFSDAQGKVQGLVGVAIDVTDRLKAEQETARLAAILDVTPNMVGMTDTEGRVIYINPAGRKLLGLDADATLTSSTIADFHSAEDLQRMKTGLFSTAERDGSVQTEIEFLHRDGHSVPTMAVFLAHKLQGTDKFTHYSVIARDLTKEKEAHAKMEHMQRLESLGVLAGGIAHDFNNILTAIMGNASLAKIKEGMGDSSMQYLERIEESSQRAAELCKQMLAYSGKGKFVVKLVNLSEMISDITRLLEVSIAKNVVLKLELSHDIPAVSVDVAQLRQVIMNLLINASDAMGDAHGDVVIRTGVMQASSQYLEQTYMSPDTHPGSYVYLEIEDTGCGMSQETKIKLFDPFFTTKFTGRGLGMSAVLGIVRGHQGAIRVESEQGVGTTFRVLLPASSDELEEGQKTIKAQVWQGTGTVLIVDDEEMIREAASLMLKRLGFDTLFARDGVEGVDVFREHQHKIVLVLMDMTMPRMNGAECFQKLHEMDPKVKVILSSGYDEQDATSHFVNQGLAGFIQKPYTMESLTRIIREAVESSIHS